MGSDLIEGGARRGTPVARPWGVGRGAPTLLREHPRSAPRVLTVPNELANECLWGGSAPPNGSRLSCGRNARGRASARRFRVWGGAQLQFYHNTRRPSAPSACLTARMAPRLERAARRSDAAPAFVLG